MQPWVVILIVVGIIALGWVANHFGWIDLSNKSRTSGSGGIAGIGDEVFHPTRHEAQVELDRQTILPAPAPLPGDDDFGMGAIRGVAARDDLDNKNYDGQVRIDLSDKQQPPRGKHSADDS
ncbi:MAG: hypothetical protein BGO97_05710 [Micrococcales bacterium 70-64]|nr:hypothetical protein [Leifsonia sp.]ODU63575.1 MAG: hypothetical protein ABT06_05715 [Leifsonia sp. SCN 70-46]OJX85266.1 MAG: hypothetical protein BGO97_05710 [Micrococcales bacterium 70-64]